MSIFLSEDTYGRCLKKYGENYFENVVIHFLKEDDIVTTWLGQEVSVLEVPGHDEGQIAFMPKSRSWCIVGDLFQGIGTVVVGGDEGDMQKYFHSLKKIIHLSPKSVVPSHGIMLGGTHILEKTLKHREIREAQVLELVEANNTVDQILSIIYFDLPKKLLPYAKANIESHLVKLKKEGRIS